MRTIEPVLPKHYKELMNNVHPSYHDGLIVSTYADLVHTIAEISYYNKDYMLFFRGQNKDYLNKANATTIYPSIYRGESVNRYEIQYRFKVLESSSKQLIEEYRKQNLIGYEELKRKKYIQWSILQHYEVCGTPLLDITHSLRVACSFAQLNANEKYSFVYVIALPYPTNRISINSEHDIINIRLLSICPPEAMRPYFQEGYLVGTNDILDEYSDKTELDLKNRLILKIRIPNSIAFWGRDSAIDVGFLFPENDTIGNICKSIISNGRLDINNDDVGQFIKKWNLLEKYLMQSNKNNRINWKNILDSNELSNDVISKINYVRKFRNNIVHNTQNSTYPELEKALIVLNEIIKVLDLSSAD